MRRREFILGSTAGVLAQITGAGSFAQAPTRAAVVIGVDKPGNLPKLSAAASGARDVADWLKSQGFEIHLFVDDKKPVREAELFGAVSDLVKRGTLEQLVVYFSGHGYLVSRGEYWLLSEAPTNPNAAINLTGSMDLARQTGIGIVTFISDACRSNATSLSVDNLHGTLLFPSTDDDPPVQTSIDLFLATRPGRPAFELPVNESSQAFEGLFTSCFLSAVKTPPRDLLTTVDGSLYVARQKLKKHLEAEVVRRSEAKSVKFRQRPEIRIESLDSYIGKVENAAIRDVQATALSSPTLTDVASTQLAKVGIDILQTSRVMNVGEVNSLTSVSGFERSQYFVETSQITKSFETTCGFVVRGTRVLGVTSGANSSANVLASGDGLDKVGLVSVSVAGAGGSVGLQFSDGGGVVLAALPEFVGSVAVEAGAVVNVSYIPAINSSRWQTYRPGEKERLDKLRAVVATSAAYGEFNIEAERGFNASAERLGDQIRLLKGVDPTLALYAAYAYADAGQFRNLQSMRESMRADLGCELFDIYLLADRRRSRSMQENVPVAPFCPMLSQGWNLLESRLRYVSPELRRLQGFLRTSPWTVFNPEGYALASEAMKNGSLR